MRFIRRNAIALTALVFAMTGTGIAASRYIITSTSQIKPSVLRELRSELAHAAEVKAARSGAHAVVDRPHVAAPFVLPESPEQHEAVFELAGSTWTQHVEELQGIVGGDLRVTGSSEAGARECAVTLKVRLDGKIIGRGGVDVAEDQTVSTSLTWGQYVELGEQPTKAVWWLAEAEVSARHQLEVTATSNCGGRQESVEIEALRLSVIGFK